MKVINSYITQIKIILQNHQLKAVDDPHTLETFVCKTCILTESLNRYDHLDEENIEMIMLLESEVLKKSDEALVHGSGGRIIRP
ncbi:MAG: hypothetical protein ABI045_05620 [Flavobacteriales bacterium]